MSEKVHRCEKHGETKILRCRQCDIENPFPKNKNTRAHLKWIRQRLRDYYGIEG